LRRPCRPTSPSLIKNALHYGRHVSNQVLSAPDPFFTLRTPLESRLYIPRTLNQRNLTVTARRSKNRTRCLVTCSDYSPGFLFLGHSTSPLRSQGSTCSWSELNPRVNQVLRTSDAGVASRKSTDLCLTHGREFPRITRHCPLGHRFW